MPVFLEELNLRFWTGPRGCSHCSTQWFNPYGRHISSAAGEKAGLKRSICDELLLLQSCFMKRERGTCFSLSPKDKPGTYEDQGAGWGGGWRGCCHHPSTHNSIWSEGNQVFGCCEIVRSLAYQLDPSSSSYNFDCFESKPWDELWQQAVSIEWLEPPLVAFLGRVLKDVVLCWDFCFLWFFFFFIIFPFLQRRFLQRAVSWSGKEC